VYTNESWSEITPEFARTYTTYRPDYVKYCSSKKEAELAIWEFVRSEKPGFSVGFPLSVHANGHVRLLHGCGKVPFSRDMRCRVASTLLACSYR
jgi:hypothetical protein